MIFIIYLYVYQSYRTEYKFFNPTTLYNLLLVEKFISIESNQLEAKFYVVILFIQDNNNEREKTENYDNIS